MLFDWRTDEEPEHLIYYKLKRFKHIHGQIY